MKALLLTEVPIWVLLLWIFVIWITVSKTRLANMIWFMCCLSVLILYIGMWFIDHKFKWHEPIVFVWILAGLIHHIFVKNKRTRPVSVDEGDILRFPPKFK